MRLPCHGRLGPFPLYVAGREPAQQPPTSTQMVYWLGASLTLSDLQEGWRLYCAPVRCSPRRCGRSASGMLPMAPRGGLIQPNRAIHLRYQGTVQAYRRALRAFFRFLKPENKGFPQSSNLLDQLLAEFINELFQEGESPGQAGCALSGLKRFIPRLRGKLPTSQQFYSNWVRVHTPVRTPPIPWTVVKALAEVALLLNRPRLAACFTLQLLCFLNSGKKLALTSADVACLPSHIVLALHSTKTCRGRVQSVSLFDPSLIHLLQPMLAIWSPQDIICPVTAFAMRAFFQKVLEFLLIPPLTFSLYSLRRGGATYHWQRTRNFESTMLMGNGRNNGPAGSILTKLGPC